MRPYVARLIARVLVIETRKFGHQSPAETGRKEFIR
jgi:hypothetical protein